MTNPEVGDLVLAALEAALEHEGETRLLTSGTHKGLLPGGRATAAKSQAKDQCLDHDLGLFTCREVEEGKGKSVAKVPFVTITRRGIEFLFERRTPAERRELLDKCANPHKEVAHEAMLHATEEELRQIDSQRERLDKRAAELRQLVRRVVGDQLAALDRARKELEQQHAELEQLANLVNESKGPPIPEPRREAAPRATPVSEGDIDFQQHVCRELVFAWQDNPEPEVRAALQVAMENAGLEQVGEVGEMVAFDNRDHRTDSDLLPGQPAVVVEPGWQLVSPRGTLLIAPMQVNAATKAGEVGHAPHAEH